MNRSPLQILLLEDDADYAQVFIRLMQRRGHSLKWSCDLTTFSQALNDDLNYDMIIMDLKLAAETSLSAIAAARASYPQAKILIVTGYASIATTVAAIKQGADDYLPKPVTVDDILAMYYGESQPVQTTEDKPLSPKRLEWEHIQRVLKDNDGNISRTAEQLNMHRRTLQRKLQKKPSRQ